MTWLCCRPQQRRRERRERRRRLQVAVGRRTSDHAYSGNRAAKRSKTLDAQSQAADFSTTSTETTSPPRFVHTPLPDPAKHSRRLRFEEGCSDTGIRCPPPPRSLELVVLPSTMHCRILGGETAPLSRHHVGRPTIRDMAEVSLRTAAAILGLGPRAASGSMQIRIDQGNPREKGTQVRMTGDIFSDASTVRASVGRHENDSELLLSGVVGWCAHLRRCPRSPRQRARYTAEPPGLSSVPPRHSLSDSSIAHTFDGISRAVEMVWQKTLRDSSVGASGALSRGKDQNASRWHLGKEL